MFDNVPTRFVLAVLAFFGFQNLYLMRFNFSVISVGMIKSNMLVTNSTITNTGNGSQSDEMFQENTDQQSSSNWMHNNEALEWSETVRGLFMGSFFYGYAITQILGGRLAELYGTKMVFGVSVAVPALLVYAIPLGAKIHYSIAIVLRILQGMIQGMSWPSMHALLSRWIPPNERSRFVGIIYFASSLSFIIVLPLSGALMEKYSWESACYIEGVFPLIWALFWFSFVHDAPSVHPRISEKEKNYIEGATKLGGTNEEIKHKKVPWKSIFSSLPFIAILIIDQGDCWGMITISTQLPRYINEIHGHQFSKSGFYGGLPFLFRYFGAIIFSCIADWLITQQKLSIGKTRRMFAAIAMFGPAISLIFFLYIDGGFGIIIALQCAAMFLNGGVACSYIINPADIAPNYSGTLYGITNSLCAMTSFLTQIVCGLILDTSYETHEKWNIIFWICVPLYIIPGGFYAMYGSGKVQPWNDYSNQIVQNQNRSLSLKKKEKDVE